MTYPGRRRMGAQRKMCDVCGVRPAVVTVRRSMSGEPPRTENLCEVHAAEAGVGAGRSPFGGSSLGGGSLFDDYFGRYFADATNELLQRAARRAMERGSLDLTNEHLLHAALEDGAVRRVLEEVDAEPGQIRAELEEESGERRDGRSDVAPSLAPEAKRALLAAYEESQALGASYIGPEHVLLALALDEESETGRLLRRFGLSHTRLRGAVVRGVDTSTGAARGGQGAGASS